MMAFKLLKCQVNSAYLAYLHTQENCTLPKRAIFSILLHA